MSNAKMLEDAGKLAGSLVSLSAAARIAGVTRQAVTQHVERGHIASVQVGSNRFITLADVQKLITRYAMTGRRPKHEEATAARNKVMKAIGSRAKQVVAGLVEVMRRRDVAVEAIKDKYADKIAKEPKATERKRLRAQRDKQVAAAKAEYQSRLDRLHTVRVGLLEKTGR
jgi:hypothetical protein